MARGIGDRLPPLPLPDLGGRRAVVTGASAGIGRATADALAGAGAEVVLAVRDAGRGDAAAAQIRHRHRGAEVSVELVDLASLVSIADASARIGQRPVHLLVNNAGTGTDDPDARTADGFDLQVGVNHLGAWALTAGLWPALRDAGDARVVSLGSTMATRGRIGPGFGRPTRSTYQSYCDSKLATVVFAGELRRRCLRAGIDVTAVPAHPGWCATAIFDTGGPPAFVTLIGRLTGAIQSPADGAQPVLLAATDPHPGAYYGPTRHRGSAGPAGPARLPEGARKPGIGERLWELSTELTGVALAP
ncbi:MAG: SDR family NAD(P)-dependent oxidoreductase [Propionicimonas sp.]|uniref:SDR family NAD(P)-dependent oxidoreductase n=1 Tax=Propionicimonas sp. TaxID=1955623 RepID=UPI003D11D59D